MNTKKAAKLMSAVLLGGVVSVLGLTSSASAAMLVVCGPNGAARIVDTLPTGCHVVR